MNMPALDVGCADKTAMGAFENPSAWRVPLAAFRYRACLAGKAFVHIVENGDTFGLGFVGDIFTHSAMRPVREFLLTLPMKAFAVCNISNIADSYLSDTVFKAPVDHCATDLVTE